MSILTSQRVEPRDIEEELRESYLDYSMSTIVQRALPDVRDGLKPSQRRILIAMNDLNLAPGRPYRKCAKIAGDTSGNYHPHGESVVYPTLVRMAQDFTMRYPLVDGQGNFGSIDGDTPAAMRYTEARLARAAVEVLSDLDKDTVDFRPNYDETRQEPWVLPGRFPNLLANGASGIAVGMATNIPPHNLCELVDGLVALIDDPDLEAEDLLAYITAPDFPTGGIICGETGVREAYLTGRGRVIVRARAAVETHRSGRQDIIVTEIPYQVIKSNLLTRIADLVRSRRIEGISDLRDESDRDGMRIVIELKRDASPEVVLNQLFKRTQMQDTFGVLMLALVDGQPRTLNIRELLQPYLDHRHEVVIRRSKFELEKAEARAHVLEGLKIAIDHIDEIIALIRRSKSADTARKALMKNFELSEVQATAILDMQLRRLAALERKKIEQEYRDLIKRIEQLRRILAQKALRMRIIRDELVELKEKFGDERRTDLAPEVEEISLEDTIAEEDMVITISHSGYIKRIATTTYRRQARGGRGIRGMETKAEDFVEHLFIASTHHYICFLTDHGRLHWLKVYDIPQAGRAAKGKPIVNALQLGRGEKITAFVATPEFPDDQFLLMVTRKGSVKKTQLSQFGNPRRVGINAMTLAKGDELIEAKITDGTYEVVVATKKGKAIRFREDDVRTMGRSAAGVKAISLEKGDDVVGMVVSRGDATVLSVCRNGYGKRSSLADYRLQTRGGKGVINIKATRRNGPLVAIREVVDEDELMIITRNGVAIRMGVGRIRVMSRNTQGVKLINLDSKDVVADVARIGERVNGSQSSPMVPDTEDVETENDG
jgi:DNA gyrase subunit A